MKTRIFLSLLLLATVVPGALAAADEAETKAHSRSDSVLVSPVGDPAVTNVLTKPDSTQGNEVVMVALPFSSFQLNPSLATYLSLAPSQVEAIQRVMMWEKHSLEPLMTQLRNTRERLLAIGTEHLNAKQVKALADTEASLLARLIVANARMQSKIFNILSAEQQKKLRDLERTQGALTSDGK